MTKTQEQRVLDAAKALYANVCTWNDATEAQRNYWLTRAGTALEAADREPEEPERPKWPTDESVAAYFGYTGHSMPGAEEVRKRLGPALLADPIIQTAVEFAHSGLAASYTEGGPKSLVDAVNAAGL